jgi:U3 small nucleolar RNA-associated protein 19
LYQTSSLQILFSLQKHLSTAQTAATSASFSRPEFHLSHFRKIVSGLLLSPSRDGKYSEIDPDIVDKFYETWFSVYDDIRWFFLRECVNVLEKAPAGQISTATNLLSILERLQTFPTDNEELNAWWVAELGAKPPKPKKIASEDDDEDALPKAPEDGEDDDDDWRKFFDEPAPVDDSKKSKSPAARLHKMTVHQSLHSLPSHRAVFTRAWLALLPRLSAAKDEDVKRSLAIRALNVMHRGVLPHLTRAILAMDWIAGCVDHGWWRPLAEGTI